MMSYNVKTMRPAYACAAMACIVVITTVLIAGCTGDTSIPVTSSPTKMAPESAPAQGSVSTPSDLSISPDAASTKTDISGSGTLVPTIYVNSTSNGEIVTIAKGERILIRLKENPTTGYSWNSTISKGLDVISDTYVAPHTGLVGAPGYHEWILSPRMADTYTFKAVYFRPWEGAKATDESFSLVIQATNA